MDGNSRFFVWAKKNELEEIYKKKTLSKRAVSYFLTTEVAKVKRARGNEKIAIFDHSVRTLVT